MVEGFVTDIIMESLPFSNSAVRLEEMIKQYLNGHERKERQEASTERRLQEIERKMENLLDAVERGIGLETIVVRIKDLENEKKTLGEERSRITAAERHLDQRRLRAKPLLSSSIPRGGSMMHLSRKGKLC